MTRHGARVIVLAILATAGYLVLRYDSLPWLLPVHFNARGAPNGWQYRTPARVFMPVFVQLSLALVFGGIALLLLMRREAADADAPDVKAAATAAEAVTSIAAIWVTFQACAALSLTNMWTHEHGGLGLAYQVAEGAAFVLTVVVGIRAHVRLGRPQPLPYVAQHWRLGQLYKNADNPALFVPTRDGTRWTLNFGRPVAVALLGTILFAGAVVPTIILALALR